MSESQKASLTHYVAGFVCDTKLGDIPQDVMELGKKSMLEWHRPGNFWLGGQVGGAGSQAFEFAWRYRRPATVFGSSIKTAPRFAALQTEWAFMR